MCPFSFSQGSGNGYFIVTVAGGSVSPTGKLHDIGSSDGSNKGTYSAQAYGLGDSCSGTVTYTFTWYSSNPGMPVPTNAILKETSSASWTGGPGACADGLGDPAVNQPTAGGSTGTHYEIKTLQNGSFTEPITASANASSNSTVTESVVGTPVLMSVSGTTLYGGQLCGLIGYHENATITAGTYTLGQFSYMITGADVYKSSNGPTSASHSWSPLLSNDLTQPSVNYAFGKNDNAVTSATANVIIGGNSIGSVAATANIYDSAPWFALTASTNAGGYTDANGNDDTQNVNPATMTTNPNYDNQNLPAAERPGIIFSGYVCETPWQAAYFGNGATFATSQIVSASASWMDLDDNPELLSEYGNDNDYPTPFDPPQNSSYLPVPSAATDPRNSAWLVDDTPDFGDFYVSGGFVNINDTFERFLVFNSGPNQDDVPLKGLNWNWITQNKWISYTDPDNYWSAPVNGAKTMADDPDPFTNFIWNKNVTNTQ